MPSPRYEKVKAQANAASLERSQAGRDITAGYPKPGDLDARAACERDFQLFCEWYFPAAFNMAWSKDHILAIKQMQEVVLSGGLFALAMPRGSGKTTLSVRAAIWALLYGHRRFICLVAATEAHAGKLLEHFKTELTFNEKLIADFRQVCYPLVKLENNGRKAIGQLFDGQQTRIGWGDNKLTFPTVPDWACDGVNVSGSTVSVAGLTGALRGQSTTLPSGEIIRPELVLLDDPQTRESAMSLSQSATREAVIKSDVLGMAGPGKKIAAIMPCTVIRKDDMADLMLDREKNPAWSGQKTKLVYAFPKAEKLWEEYRRLWTEGLKGGRGIGEATEFYRQRQTEMDEGSEVAWPERFYPDELSAVQHAMNLRYLDESAFMAEYQNEPFTSDDALPDDLTADQIASRVNRQPRRQLAIASNHLTAFIDVQGSLLYYVVTAWEDGFSGQVVDYGTWPEQKLSYFTLREAKQPISSVIKDAGLEGQLHGALDKLTDHLLSRSWTRDDGAELKIERLLIDANWGVSTDVIYKFVRQSPHAAVIMPSHGKFIGAGTAPMRDWQKKIGDRVGMNWKIPVAKGRRNIRHVIFDTNFWKSFIHARLSTAIGDGGALTLFGEKAAEHRMFADHCVSESRVRTQGRGRTVDEWKHRPERPDNHWWDCLVGCAVAASMMGCELIDRSMPIPAKDRPARVRFSDLQKQRRA